MKKILLTFGLVFSMLFAGITTPAHATPAPLLMTFTFDNTTGKTVAFPLSYGSNPNAVVDWGDSSPTETWTSKGYYTHTYTDYGTYQVSITGTIGVIGHNGFGPSHFIALRSVDAWGDGLESVAIFLSGAKNLVSVPSTLPARFTDTSWMFYYGGAIPAAVANWDMSHVKVAAAMFFMSSLDLDLSNWQLTGLDTSVIDVFGDTGWNTFYWAFRSTPLSKENYSSMLNAWSLQALPSGGTLDASAQYCASASTARANIISNKGWAVNDGGLGDCLPAPTVSSITPNLGSIAGGTSVTISGSNFASGATVTIGGTTCGSVTVDSSSQITCTTGSHSAGGPYDVVVTNSNATSGTGSGLYTYDVVAAASPTVSTISPSLGSIAGGTSVTISGSNFRSGATVTIGGTTCGSVSVDSSSQITCTTGSHSAGGPYDVVVTNSDSTAGTGSALYTYDVVAAGPTISSVAPQSGPVGGGTILHISGANFVAPATVTIGGSTCTNVTVVSSTEITCVTPAKSAGSNDVVVTSSGSSATLTSGFASIVPYFTWSASSISVGQTVSQFTNVDLGNLAAIFFDGVMPQNAYGPIGGVGNITWNTWGGCQTFVLTIRTYDRYYLDGFTAPAWSDPYLTSSDITWVGDPTGQGCSVNPPPPPAATEPSSITGSGRTRVISGTHLSAVTTVKVGGISVKFTRNADGTLTIELPDLAAGIYDVDLVTGSETIHWEYAVRVKTALVTKAPNKSFTKRITGFAGNSAVLSSKQKAAIKAALAGVKRLTCIGTTSSDKVTPGDRKLALARAKAACAYAKKLYPRLIITLASKPAIGLGAYARRVELILTK